MFRQLFERSADAIFLLDPRREIFVDCNQAAVEMMRASSKQQLLMVSPAELSPEFQPDGKTSREKTPEVVDLALSKGSHRFEWHGRRMDGEEFPVEVLLTAIQTGEHPLLATVCRDISARKRAELEILEFNASLEQRVAQRTDALRASEEKFRALFEGSSQGVVLHDENQILEANPAAVRILGCQSPQEILGKHPADTSPPFQPNGESSAALAGQHIQECMTNGSARFEWTSCTPQGQAIPLEVTLTRIQWSGRQLIQALISDISERKKAEAELRAGEARLRESEARFSAAFRASPVFITIARMDNGHYILVNEAFLKLIDYRLEEVLGHNSKELALWADPADRERFWDELRCTGSIHERECRARNRQGKIFTLLVSSDVIEIADVPHLLTVGLDITERKQGEAELRASEARLRESEARFSAAFHSSPIITGITRARDGTFVLVNDASLAWSGYSREEALGRAALELGVWVSAEERDEFWNAVRRSGGSTRERECRLRNRHGKISTMLGSGAIIVLNGEDHLLFMMIDISERKKAEAEVQASEARLRESEARFSAAFHSSPIITGVCRASDRQFVLVNDASLEWAGYRREEAIGRTSIELGIWENPGDRERMWEDVRRAGSIRGRECRLRNRFGIVSTMLASGAMIEINGEDHLLVMMVDISQRKQMEADLHGTLAREMELSQLKSNFVSMVSHEFRTPLGIIQSSAELLRDFHLRMQPAERHEHLESVVRNTARMASMMEEILVLSRLDAGKLDFQPATLDLKGFCRRLVDEVRSATSRRCPIELSLASIPPEARADEKLLGHILTNLLNNAVKYSEPGATVSFSIERDGADAVCTVRDRGIGIDEEDQQHLFQAFHRGSNVGTRPGTGLGLLVVKRCVELHRGSVRLSSKPGEGTRVMVRLPVFEKDA
jgi:PAS domain S-box-containing protein